MIKDITIGQYYAGKSPLHRMDTRMKLVLTLVFMVVLAACGRATPYEPTTTITTTTEATTTLPQDETREIYHTVTARVHPDMPEFTFTLRGVWTSRHSTFSTQDRTDINSIEIRDEDNTLVQMIDGLETHQSWMDGRFELLDFNQDGYLDMQLVILSTGVGSLSVPSYFWLWDNAQGMFMHNDQLHEISQTFNVQLEDDGRVLAQARASAPGGTIREWYVSENGEFVQVEVHSYTMEWSGNDNDEVIHRVFHKQRRNGQWHIIEDREERHPLHD